MMIDWAVLVSAFLLGLLSSTHCIGMCGGIMGALSMAIPAQAGASKLVILLCYNLGRLLSYGLMGLLVGLFAQQINDSGGAPVLRWLAGLLLIAMGLYLANWWRGLTYLESLGRYLWVYVQPLGKRLMPVNSPAKGLLLGALWGWLPCGLVYSALSYAMVQGHWLVSGLAMLAFGLGTLPSLLLAGMAAQQLNRLLQQRSIRWVMALLIMLFGLWTLLGAGVLGLGHNHNHNHNHDHQHSVVPEPGADTAPTTSSEPVESEQSHHHHH